MKESKFRTCICANCGKELSCYGYFGGDHDPMVFCSKECAYDFIGYDEEDIMEYEKSLEN